MFLLSLGTWDVWIPAALRLRQSTVSQLFRRQDYRTKAATWQCEGRKKHEVDMLRIGECTGGISRSGEGLGPSLQTSPLMCCASVIESTRDFQCVYIMQRAFNRVSSYELEQLHDRVSRD